jgi:Holliday junction resolvasome RuvABC DNA-binding subunit
MRARNKLFAMHKLTNHAVASKLREMADALELQEADGFRMRAYVRAADTIDQLPKPIEKIFAEGGIEALDALPGIGRGIASAIREMLLTGRWSQLERLKGELEPELLFQMLPGVGPELAAKIHDLLDVDTLEALEVAAHDGRLEAVPGIGPRRAMAIRFALDERLGHRRIRRDTFVQNHLHAAPVAMLLDVDREYRVKSNAGALRKIAPKRFNPKAEAWLPILHTGRGDWEFTALFSNTKTAHDLAKTNDWVVLYHHRKGEPEQQCTIVTEGSGACSGQRVIRGRELECVQHYAQRNSASSPVRPL